MKLVIDPLPGRCRLYVTLEEARTMHEKGPDAYLPADILQHIKEHHPDKKDDALDQILGTQAHHLFLLKVEVDEERAR